MEVLYHIRPYFAGIFPYIGHSPMIQNEILGYPIFSQTIKAILANVAQQQ